MAKNMNKKWLILIFSTLIFLPLFNKPVEGNLVAKSDERGEIVRKKLDNKAQILSAYLASYDSPLEYHAQDFVDAAKEYNLDWKMLPAIAGVESTFGRFIPGGYNAYGWGVYGNQAIYFKSWKEGIFTVAKGLRENYFNRGLTEPYSINRVYAASPRWGGNVTYFMRDLEKFAARYEAKQKQLSQAPEVPKIAAISGQLAFR